jgi:hypothetical protein
MFFNSTIKFLARALLLLLCAQAHAALSPYGVAGDVQGSSPQTRTFTTAVANGDLMIVKVPAATATAPVCSDNVSTGANWALVSGTGQTDGTSPYYFYWFEKVMNVTSGTAPTLTCTSGGFINNMNVVAITGFVGSPAFDATNTNLQTGTTTGGAASTTQTSAHAGEILLAHWYAASFFTAAPSPSWANWPSSAWPSVLIGPLSSGTNANASWTPNAASYWVQSLIGVYDAGAGTCTHYGWTKSGTWAIPNGSTGSYWSLTGNWVTPNCSSINYWQQNGSAGAN